jgi:hypothetical protein
MTERKWVTSNKELGYFAEGEPTDAQTEFQDDVDNTIHNLLNELKTLYLSAAGKSYEEEEWDIGKITAIREEVEDQLGLPDVY